MTNVKRITALLLALIMAVSFTACSKKGEKMNEWLDTFSAAYDGYVASADGENAVYPNVSLLVSSSAYLKAVFDYIDSGKMPESAEITEENGVYTYKSGYFKQIIEIDTKTPAIRVEMIQDFMGEGTTEYITVFTEKSGEYFIQQHLVEFGEYYEIRFTAEGGSTTIQTDCYELPYSIFEGEIPESFAKEN